MRNIAGKIKNGEVALGFNLMYPAEGIIERVGPDWDWIWIDGQHGQHDYKSILAAVRAADFSQVDSLVRVPGHDPGWIGRALDTGASGIIVPQVDDAAQARAIVKAAKYAPLGARSFGGRRVGDLYGRSYARSANDDILLAVQIESRVAIDNAEDILSVPGIDAFFFGPDDVALIDGLPMDQPRDPAIFNDILEHLINIARKYGVAGGGAFPSPETASSAVSLGYTLLGVGGDVGLLAAASTAHRKAIDLALDGVSPAARN
ncbi:MAG: hypothetical protein HN368_22435 [Spirochaetales bacterium]|nr:hypothetical protein [Spirochaetales bacterium]